MNKDVIQALNVVKAAMLEMERAEAGRAQAEAESSAKLAELQKQIDAAKQEFSGVTSFLEKAKAEKAQLVAVIAQLRSVLSGVKL